MPESENLPQDGDPSAFSDLSNAMPIPNEWHKAQAPCDCCGFPVPVLEAHGVGLYGLHFGLLHPKCADFANKIADHLSPPKRDPVEHRKYTPANQGDVWVPCRCHWSADHGA